MKDNARIVRFSAETLDIDKIGVGRRAAVPKSEAADPNVRRGITTSKVQLVPREIMVPFEISDTFKDINIEGDKVEEHIIQMMAKRLANDLEDLYINGDTVGVARLESDMLDNGDSAKYVKDSYLALQDGWSRLADAANVVDAGGANVGLSVFGKALRAMPTKFRRDMSALRFIMSPNLHHLYLEKLSTRGTMQGDNAAGGGLHMPFGVQCVKVPLWDFQPLVVENVTMTGTTVQALRYGPVSSVVVTPSTLSRTPTTPYIEDTDYTVDTAAGTIVRISTGAISGGQVVKVTYQANPQMLLTHQSNMIVGIGRDIKIEKDREIFKGVNQYAITVKVAVTFEESSAIVKVKNIGTDI